MSNYLVIFGAAVREDGSPSGTLRRRCKSAVRAGQAIDDTIYLPSGGVGRHGPVEALVMRELLMADGVPPQQIVVEVQATDTLQSVRLCSQLLRAHGAGKVPKMPAGRR